MSPRGFRLHVSGGSPSTTFLNVCAQAIRTGSSNPLPPDNGNRGGGTENVSFPKPVSAASCHVDRSHCLGNLRFAIHPLAQFLSSVLKNNSDLIFITVLVRHLFLPSATTVLGFT